MATVDDLVTYIRLAPEFGGTRFGPFEGLEVRLGSNPERCHIVLSEALGVLPEHAKLLRQRDNSLILTPAERTATLFLWKPGDRRPSQVHTPTAIRPGDAFSLVTHDGPRFFVELDQLPPEVKAAREQETKVRTGRRRLSAETMAAEGKRQAWSSLLTMGPAQLAQRAWVYIKSGAIYQPRNIFLGVAILGGYIFGGWAMCSRKKYATEVTRVESERDACNEQVGVLKELSDSSGKAKFHLLAASVTNSTKLGAALENDDALRAAVEREVKNIFLNPTGWSWIVEPKSKAAAFAAWREQLFKETDMDVDTEKLLMWLAADPTSSQSEFVEQEDSTGNMVCGRGPIFLTYLHARNLGMEALPDALLQKGTAQIKEDTAKQLELLAATLHLYDPAAVLPEETVVTKIDPVRSTELINCLYSTTGTDERVQRGVTINTLAKHLGKSGSNLPPDTSNQSSVARVAKFWSAAAPVNDLTVKGAGYDFTASSVGPVLDSKGATGAWVLSQTAKTIAKSIAVPCVARLKGDPKEVGKIIGEDNVPAPFGCLYLDWTLRNQE